MSLLPPTATFSELVAECFVAHRGSGLMLSALDAELLFQWEETGAPYEVIARGIRRAAEKALFDARPGEPALHSLRACKREVETEIRRHLRLRSGAGAGLRRARAPADPLKRMLRGIAKSRPALAAVCKQMGGSPFLAACADPVKREAFVTAKVLRALTFQERLEHLQTARALLGENFLSQPAKTLALRFHRASVLKRRLDLPSIW